MSTTYDTLNNVLVRLFHDIMTLEEKAIRTGEFSEISNNDMHIIEAIGIDEPRNMSFVAKKLSVTVGTLTIAVKSAAESNAEQASAGLDKLTPDEFARFHELNAAYNARFGFPFIIAVRDHDKPGIMAAMRRRIDHDTATERHEAERQVARIGELRLQQLLGDS